jgi:cell wall-associated NlpC family hydrolase
MLLTKRTDRRRTTRRITMIAAALLTVAVSVIPTLSSAAPSQQDVENARRELQALEHDFEAAAERYNHARYLLSENEERLSDAKEKMDAAQAVADEALAQLEERAVDAYTGMGSQMGSILDAGSISEFSDRLQFMGAISASDTELATTAEATRQRAEWAAEQYAAAVEESREHLDAMADARADIERMLDEQEATVADLEAEYRAALEAQRRAAERAAAAEATAATEGESSTSSPPSSSSPAPGTGGGYIPPSDGSKAQVAVQAAYSIIGSPYVWGSSDPSVGLDCSGVTVYAWGQAGVSLPHSAAAQYSMFPKIPLDAVQPGDLVYYGNFGPHIAIYVGGGQIIHASSPRPGGQARLDSMYGYDDPWGAVRVT